MRTTCRTSRNACSSADFEKRVFSRSQTATVYVRGSLQHHAGVPLSSIKWIQAGVDDAGRQDPVELRLPAGVTIESIRDRTLSEMLVQGEIDAIITARPPRCFMEGEPVVR